MLPLSFRLHHLSSLSQAQRHRAQGLAFFRCCCFCRPLGRCIFKWSNRFHRIDHAMYWMMFGWFGLLKLCFVLLTVKSSQVRSSQAVKYERFASSTSRTYPLWYVCCCFLIPLSLLSSLIIHLIYSMCSLTAKTETASEVQHLASNWNWSWGISIYILRVQLLSLTAFTILQVEVLSENNLLQGRGSCFSQ